MIAPKNVSSFSEWSSRQASINSTNASLDLTISLWILASSEFFVFIVTGAFDPPQWITIFLTNYNLTLSQSDSYITRVLRYSICGWILKGTSFLGLWIKVLLTFILKYIFDKNSPHQMELRIDVIWIIWEFSFWHRPMETLLADICELKISTENSGKGSRSNVYSLDVLRSSTVFLNCCSFCFTALQSCPIGKQGNRRSVLSVRYL